MTKRAKQKSFAEKLQGLREKVRRPDGKPYTLKEIEAETGISFSYLRALLRGDRRNPTARVEKALTDFFGVDNTYFREEPSKSSTELAQKINYLLAAVTSPDGDPYTAEEIEKRTHGKISQRYFENLKAGIATNPTQDQIATLARLFGVDAGFFFKEKLPSEVKIDDKILKILKDAKALKIAFRVTEELDEESKDHFLKLIDQTIRFSKKTR